MGQINVSLGSDQAVMTPQQPRILIGRADRCDLVTPIPGVSRQHAEMYVAGDNVLYIRDLGTVNGTWVNGQYAQQPTPVSPGCQVYIGSTPLHVEWRTGPQKGATQMLQAVPPQIADGHRISRPEPHQIARPVTPYEAQIGPTLPDA
mgnify:CR=1 FL=1